MIFFFFFSSRRRHTRSDRDWSSDVCSSDLAGRALHCRFQHPEIGIDVARIGAERKTRADERALQRALLADPHPMIFEMRAAAACCAEDLLAHGVLDHRTFEPAFLLAGDRHGESRKAVQEVGGAVERIDDPDRIVVPAAATLLGKDRMVRIVAADDADDLLLGGTVDLTDEIVTPFRGDREGLQPVEAADDDFAGAARGADCDIEKRVHGSSREGAGPLRPPLIRPRVTQRSRSPWTPPISASFSWNPHTPATSAPWPGP